MNTSFGPWATAIEPGSSVPLSALWRRRMQTLGSLSAAGSGMSRRQALAAGAAALALWALPTLTNFAAADEPPLDRGPISELPADGAWAEYELELRRTQNGRTETHTLRQRLASVGRTEIEGQPARWIELTLRMGEGPPIKTKVLIPERAFSGDNSPLARASVVWSQRGDDEPHRREFSPEDVRGPLGTLFPGKLSEAAALDNRTFNVKPAGEITASGRSGRAMLRDPRGADELQYQIWSNAEVPFRLVAADIEELSPDRAADRHISLRLLEFGKDAESTLPQ